MKRASNRLPAAKTKLFHVEQFQAAAAFPILSSKFVGTPFDATTCNCRQPACFVPLQPAQIPDIQKEFIHTQPKHKKPRPAHPGRMRRPGLLLPLVRAVYWMVYVSATIGLLVYPVATAITRSVSEALTVIGPVYFVELVVGSVLLVV